MADPRMADFLQGHVSPNEFDPRVMDPVTEERRWSAQAESDRRRAWQNMAMGGLNAATGAATFGASRFPAVPAALRRIMGAAGWGQMGIGGLNAGLSALDSNRAWNAQEMANRWGQGAPPDYQMMVDDAFRPRPPISR